ncbi:MAG: hypothetical protein ACI8S6_004506 [Myxococcota bacterium]|jgi:hypothetical protein
MFYALSLAALLAGSAHADSASSAADICPDECAQILHDTGEQCLDENGSPGTIHIIEEWITVYFDASLSTSFDPDCLHSPGLSAAAEHPE